MLVFHIEAHSVEELQIAACSALGLQIPGASGRLNDTFDPKHPDKGDFGTLPGEPDVLPYTPDPIPAPQESLPEPVKARRAHRRVKPVEAPVEAPVAAPEPEPDPLEEAIDALTNEVDASMPIDDEPVVEDIDIISGEPLKAVDNEMLKRDVIASLSSMFAAGNVKTVRHVLHKYGHGAKSFPEIDAVHFPEIKAALERNEAA
jgi:hypothetical protein